MTTTAPDHRGGIVVGLIREARPKQWAKNALVFVAPGAAGVLTTRQGLTHAVFAFLMFCAAAGATYILNDVLDVEADRRHPKKRHRPIAAGVVPVPLALTVAAIVAVSAVGLSVWRTWQFGLIVAVYIVLTTVYSTVLKHQPVLDVMGLASGFVLRLLGGAYAVQVAISDWFLIISCFGALFIAVCKRIGEKAEMGDGQGSTRKLLESYSDRYLSFLEAIAAGAVIISYCQFAVQRASERPSIAIWVLLSIIPFMIAILRYALLVDQGKGSAPEDLLGEDRQLQLFGVIWAALMAASVYA